MDEPDTAQKLGVMADVFETWLRDKTPGSHIIPTVWPSYETVQNWVVALKEAQAQIRDRDAASEKE